MQFHCLLDICMAVDLHKPSHLHKRQRLGQSYTVMSVCKLGHYMACCLQTDLPSPFSSWDGRAAQCHARHCCCSEIVLCRLQVPFIKWLGDLPIAGAPVGGLVGSLAGPYANVFMGRTGRHLFLQDGSPHAPPLLVRHTAFTIQVARAELHMPNLPMYQGKLITRIIATPTRKERHPPAV